MKHIIKIQNLENLPFTRPLLAMDYNANMAWHIKSDVPYDEIWYTTKNNTVKNFNFRSMPTVLSNTYENGKGVIKFNSNVTFIESYAFSNTNDITGLVFPDSVIRIEEGACWLNGSLTTINIPENVSFIQSGAFSGCNKLATITVSTKNNYFSTSDGILYNKNKTALVQYVNGKSNTTFSIPSSVTEIQGHSVQACTKLENVIIPNSVNSIGSFAFNGCWKLGPSINIPESVSTIAPNAFGSCISLTDIYVSNDNQYYTSSDGILYNKNMTKIVQYPAGKNDTSYYIPNSVTTIEQYAFDGCSSLEYIGFSNSITNIGTGAFRSSGLVSIEIPSSLTEIPSWLCDSCNQLVDISIGNNITHIGFYAFNNTNISTINIPASVNYIESNAFTQCPNLTTIICNAIIPPTASNIFDIYSDNYTIYVPATSVDAYKSAWVNYADKIQAIVENEPQQIDYYQQGYNAYSLNEENPYEPDSEEYEEWERGWNAAQTEQ